MSHDRLRGERIRRAMRERNFGKTHALAAEMNVSVATVSRWQNGGHISLQSVSELAEKLDVSLDWLLLGRGRIDWHQDSSITPQELQWVLALRLHPDAVKRPIVELVHAISKLDKLHRE